ncbi:MULTISPECIES: hypothetical protein [unclassified Serratia (in: enterobacteria)]|uniref:hypothetical protein n=1 Tax=unclassified Serratia (in: enterobacteria) TaxID=2647522 RepID=UPI00046A5F11|nr:MULTISPECIES: hypothetical protein [unclassified Serratia (in: enterobacteria)]
MELKFEVGAIRHNLRSKSQMKGMLEGVNIFHDEFIEAIDTHITVSGMPSPCLGGDSIIKLHYIEEYRPESSFADFYARAEKFAKEYCESLGITNKAAN